MSFVRYRNVVVVCLVIIYKTFIVSTGLLMVICLFIYLFVAVIILGTGEIMCL